MTPGTEQAVEPETLDLDARARREACDPERSFIVEAPAGSGKTELLMQRYLRLLSLVEEPEQVLAITFTVKAAAEMRERVFASLRLAGRDTFPGDLPAHQIQTLGYAREVLEADARWGWGLLRQPQRLNIRTIDSLCREITRRLPVLSRLGAEMQPVEDASELYTQAARTTLEELGGGDSDVDEAARTLLLHLENRMESAVRLLAQMLGTRDQWGAIVLSPGFAPGEDLDQMIHRRFEVPLERLVCRTLERASELLPTEIWEQVFTLGHSAAKCLEETNGRDLLNELCSSPGVPGCGAEDLPVWQAAARLLLKADGDLRSRVDKTIGFEMASPCKVPMQELLASFAGRDDLVAWLNDVLLLPSPNYTERQREVLRAVFQLLRRSVAHLRILFARSGTSDFTELSLAAKQALLEDTSGLALAFGTNISHLLVDEMQDTSVSHFELLSAIVKGWDGHSQTVFLVGDPKQSIYRFRNSEVGLFTEAQQHGLGGVSLEHISLRKNFRSHGSLVARTNQIFTEVLGSDPDLDGIHFEPSVAAHSEDSTERLFWHPQIRSSSKGKGTAIEPGYDPYAAEAMQICDVIEQHRASAAAGEPAPTIALLVRVRRHAIAVLSEMGRRGIAYRCVDMDGLQNRQPVLDIFAITRCLLHPADRTAWLAVLRAPWCGLTLADLHSLCGGDQSECSGKTVPELFSERADYLSTDGRRRAGRVLEIFAPARDQAHCERLSSLVERTWHTLGGLHSIPSDDWANIEQYLRMLDRLEDETGWPTAAQVKQRMDKLFAEPSPVRKPCTVEVLTMFKAKGLEWDVVLLPGLGRPARRDDPKLLEWLPLIQNHPDAESDREILLTPVKHYEEEKDRIGAWIRARTAEHSRRELKRLFYVSATRARKELHVFAGCNRLVDGHLGKPNSDSLLHAAWPVARNIFEQELQRMSSTILSSNLLQMPRPEAQAVPGVVRRIAAEVEQDELTGREAARIPLVNFRRLVTGWQPPSPEADIPFAPARHAQASNAAQTFGLGFPRGQGSARARQFGTVLHAFMEPLAAILARSLAAVETQTAIRSLAGPIRLNFLRSGCSTAEADAETAKLIRALHDISTDPSGRWILGQHPLPRLNVSPGTTSRPADFGSGFELPLTNFENGTTRSVRVDRLFVAGPAPLAAGSNHLWIVDFKTAAHGSSGMEAFLDAEKLLYSPQLSTYAEVLSRIFPAYPAILLGLYYPLIAQFIWWEWKSDAPKPASAPQLPA